MILQIFPEIQDHPYPLQMQNPVEGMNDIAILYKNPEPSIMQNEKKIPTGNPTPSIGGYGQKMEWPNVASKIVGPSFEAKVPHSRTHAKAGDNPLVGNNLLKIGPIFM